MSAKPASIPEYLDALPPHARMAIDELRSIVRTVLPDAEEVLRYGIPTFQRSGRSVVHVAGWTKHLSMYPIPECHDDYAGEIDRYRAGKGTLQFPLDQPLPAAVIEHVVRLLAARLSG